MFSSNVLNEMLNGLLVVSNTLGDVRLKYQDGTTSAAITETNLWGTPSLGVLEQDEAVVFTVEISSAEKNVSGFNLIFEDDSSLGISFDFEQIFSYPNTGTFTFDGMSIEVK